MPLYEISGPDGKTYEIEGPAGATREQVISAIQARLAEQQQKPSQQPTQQEAGNVPQEAPDFTRGISNIIPQIKSTYYGAKVMAAKAAGDKEALLQAAKDYGEANKQAATKETDSFTKAWEKGIGTVIGDWLPYQVGAGVGSLLETLTSMGIGAAAGMGVGSIPGAVSGALGKSLLKKGIKEQAEKILKEYGEDAAQAFIQKEAKKALRSYGATAGIAAQSGVHGAGEVTGRAVEELERKGKTAEDLDMSKIAPAAVVHGVADFVSDKIALGAFKNIGKKSTDSFIKDVTKAIGVTGLKEVPPETIQTIAERYGANLSLTDVDALKEYIDTAAASFAMAAVPGGVGGVRTYLSGERQKQIDENKSDIENTSGSAAATTADTIKEDAGAQVDPQKEESLAFTFDENAADPAAVAQQDTPADIETKPKPAPVVEDDELAAMRKEYADRQAKIEAGGPKKQVQNRITANEKLAKKIADKEAELSQKKTAAGYFTAEELGEGATTAPVNVTEETNTPADTSKDTSTPTPPAQRVEQPSATPPAQFDAAAFQKKIQGMTDEQIQDDVEIGFFSYTDEQLALLKDELARRKASAPAQPPATPPAQPPAETVELTPEEQAIAQAELDEALGQVETKPAKKAAAKPKLRDIKGKKVQPLKAEVADPDEIRKLGFMEQPSYHSSDQAPPDMRAGVRSAAIESAYDAYDTVDVKNGVQPELDELFEQRRKQKGKYPGAKKGDLLSYMTEKEILDLYKRHSNKRTLEDENNNPDPVREAYADVRNDFVGGLDPNQKALYNFLLDQSLLKEILAKRRRGQKRTRAVGYTRQEVAGKLSRKAKKDLEEQIAESLKTDEQIAAEETEAVKAAQKAEEERLMTAAKVAEQKQKDAAQQPRRRKITVNIEKAVNETGNVVDVLAEIADDRVNDSVTRVIAKSIDRVLEGIGAVGVKDKKPYDYTTAKIVFGEVEGDNDGKFDPATNTITLRGQNGQYTGKRKLDQVVLHEIMHYLTDHVFDNKKAYLNSIKDAVQRKEVSAAMNRLDNNFRTIRDRFGKKYNIGTIKEFIAELYSNPNFQIDLANMKASGKFEFGRISSMFTQVGRNIATALGFNRDNVTGYAGSLQQVLDDVALIISLPTPEMQGTAVSYSAVVPPPTPSTKTPKQPKRKKAEGLKPSRTNDLNDNTGYEIAEYQHPRSLKGLVKLARQASSWRAIATKFQNDRYPIKRWEDVYDGARKIFYEGVDKINNIYTQITLSTSRAKNFYNRYVKPAHEKLDNAIANFAKAANLNTDQALGFMHRLLEALHEPERRRVKYILTVPLSTDANLGLKMNGKPVSAADARAYIVEQLDTKTLTEQEARNLRAVLDKIIDTKRPDGKPKYIDPNAARSDKNAPGIPSPTNPQQAAALIDPNNDLYNVIGLGDEKTTAQEVINKRLQQYKQHPQKAEIDAVLAALREFNGPDGITTRLSKYANYWSDFVSNRVAFYDFQNYAPFKGKSKFDEHSEIDQLLDFDGTMMGRELQDAAYAFDGRTTVSDNPLLQTVSDAIRASMRAGRKELTQSIKNALEKGKYNPNGQGILKGSVKANIPFKDRMNKDIINKYKGESTIFHYNKDGSIDVLFIEDPKLRNAIRRTYKNTNSFLDKMNQATSFLGKMHTRWNYNFAPLNFVRDVLTNAWAIGAEMGPKEAGRFLGQVASKVVLGNAMPKAMRVAVLYQKGGEEAAKELERLAKKDAVYQDMIEFIQEGGMVSYLQGLSLKSNFEELQKELGRSGIVKNVQQLNKALDIWVEMFELASRSAAYSIAKQNAMARPGMTETEAKVRAATYAKNLANFEQVGEWGKTMGAFFMFFRPSSTGAVRAIEAAAPAMRKMKDVEMELPQDIKDDPAALAAFKEQYAAKQKNARIMIGSLIGMGMVSYVMSSMLSDDDDLGRNEVLNDNMDQWTRFLRFHIPRALTGDKEYTIQIPWGFGLGAFAAAGAQFMSVMYGKQSLPDALANIFLQISLDSFVPLPVSRMSPREDGLAFFIDSITPSTVRPLVEFLINKNGLGQDIYNDANRRMGDAYMGGDKIPEIYKTAAAGIANATLGAIDWSPNSLYFLSNSYADGIARLFELGYGMTNLAQGAKSFNAKTDVPLFGSFFGSRSSVDTREFAKIEKEIKEKERRINMFEKNPEKYVEYVSEYPLDVALVDYYNKQVGSGLKPLQAQANSIRLDKNLEPIDKESLLKINKFQQNLIKHHMIQAIGAYGIEP